MTNDNKMKLLDAYRMAAEGGHKEIADALASVIIGEMSGIGRGVTDIPQSPMRAPFHLPDTVRDSRTVMCETGGTE